MLAKQHSRRWPSAPRLCRPLAGPALLSPGPLLPLLPNACRSCGAHRGAHSGGQAAGARHREAHRRLGHWFAAGHHDAAAVHGGHREAPSGVQAAEASEARRSRSFLAGGVFHQQLPLSRVPGSKSAPCRCPDPQPARAACGTARWHSVVQPAQRGRVRSPSRRLALHSVHLRAASDGCCARRRCRQRSLSKRSAMATRPLPSTRSPPFCSRLPGARLHSPRGCAPSPRQRGGTFSP